MKLGRTWFIPPSDTRENMVYSVSDTRENLVYPVSDTRENKVYPTVTLERAWVPTVTPVRA